MIRDINLSVVVASSAPLTPIRTKPCSKPFTSAITFRRIKSFGLTNPVDNTSVFVQFRAIKPVEQWPPAGQRLVEIAHLVQDWWWLAIILVIAMGYLLSYLMANYIGVFRPVLDKYPPFSFYRKLVAARFLETLGLLVANGVVFKAALRVMQYQANPYLSSHLVEMEHLLSTGKSNVADVFK